MTIYVYLYTHTPQLFGALQTHATRQCPPCFANFLGQNMFKTNFVPAMFPTFSCWLVHSQHSHHGVLLYFSQHVPIFSPISQYFPNLFLICFLSCPRTPFQSFKNPPNLGTFSGSPKRWNGHHGQIFSGLITWQKSGEILDIVGRSPDNHKVVPQFVNAKLTYNLVRVYKPTYH